MMIIKWVFFLFQMELTSNSGAQGASVNEVPILGVCLHRERTGGWTQRLHLPQRNRGHT